VRIEVNQLPPVECSQNWRGYWAKRYRASEAYRVAVYYEAVNVRNLTGQPPFEKPRLDLTFIFPHFQERDEDNLRARFKPGQDALVQAELLRGDSKACLVLGGIDIVIDRSQSPKTIIELEEV